MVTAHSKVALIIFIAVIFFDNHKYKNQLVDIYRLEYCSDMSEFNLSKQTTGFLLSLIHFRFFVMQIHSNRTERKPVNYITAPDC